MIKMLPYALAPMAELSHRALRELIEGFGGCDEYYTEMISAPALLAGGPFEKWYLDAGPCPQKAVYQLVGADSASIVKAAALLDRLECAGIDINMGCSAPLIRKTGAGVAWMASTDKAGGLVKELKKTVKRRLSVKIRSGLTDNFEYLVQFCRRLEAEGVDLITLHPRTAAEKFKRRAKWGYIAALRQELHIPVAGNGDIANAEELIARDSSVCDAVMVGRAAVRQPWIFAQAKGKGSGERIRGSGNCCSLSEHDGNTLCLQTNLPDPTPLLPDPQSPIPNPLLHDTGLRFLELLSQWQPPEFHISRARRFFSFFCDNLKWGNYLKNLLNREESLSGMERVWIDYFAKEQS